MVMPQRQNGGEARQAEAHTEQAVAAAVVVDDCQLRCEPVRSRRNRQAGLHNCAAPVAETLAAPTVRPTVALGLRDGTRGQSPSINTLHRNAANPLS